MLADYRPNAGWVPDRVTELRQRWNVGRVFVDTASRGLVPGAIEVTAQDRARADNALHDALVARRVRHGNDAALNAAVRGAQWRSAGETQVLDRKGSLDISPLVAAALAASRILTSPNYDLLDSVR